MTATAPNIRFAAIGLNHSHIYGQTRAMLNAGAELVAVHADEDDLVAEYQRALGGEGDEIGGREVSDRTAGISLGLGQTHGGPMRIRHGRFQQRSYQRDSALGQAGQPLHVD